MIEFLNMTQKEALKILKMGHNVFLTGPAGSGKTYVLNEYIKFLRDHNVDVAVTASTGIAATHLKGVTVHSWAGIGIKDHLTDYDIDEMEQKAYLWKRFEKTRVLIIDEISMLSADTLDCIDRVLKVFKKNELPFGGLQVIFSGDFFQLPPIEKKNRFQEQTIFMDGPEESGVPFAFKSRAWRDAKLQTCYLKEQFRQSDDDLLDILSEIRTGRFSDETRKILNNRIIVEEDPEITKLYTHNLNVDTFNYKKLQAINQEEKTYKMIETGKAKLVEALKRGCLVPEHLMLKKGALVMFVKNNPVEGYINGTVGEIIRFDGDNPVVQTKDGHIYTAEPQTWSIEEGDKILAEIKQVPLKLAWAVTIHKSQGMTLDRAVIDLSKSFVAGQGYVALSRVKTLDGLYLLGINDMALEIHEEVRQMDSKLQNHSNKLFEKVRDIADHIFSEKHQEFFESIGATKFKVRDSKKEKLSTFEITHKMLMDKKPLDEIISERKLKIDTIISHIEKLLDEGNLKKRDISYLKPKTEAFDEMLDEISESLEKLDEFKLSPIFKDLGGKYSFQDIKFAKLFL
jgi:ATP-dependent exoDNAse (exonuclease V) alpha subunit